MKNHWLLDRPIAHRGLHDLKNGIPENSIPAFKNAVNHNYNIELDVHLSTDGEVFVFHDSNLERVCGIKSKTDFMPYEKLKDIKLSKTEYTIPLLTEVLDVINGQVGLIIELKEIKFIHPHILEEKVAKIMENYKGNFAIKSFNPFAVEWFTKNKPEYLRGQLSTKKVPYINRLDCKIVNDFQFVSYNIENLPNKMIEGKTRKKDIPLITWTIRNDTDLEKAKNNADNIIFENMDLNMIEQYYLDKKKTNKNYPKF